MEVRPVGEWLRIRVTTRLTVVCPYLTACDHPHELIDTRSEPHDVIPSLRGLTYARLLVTSSPLLRRCDRDQRHHIMEQPRLTSSYPAVARLTAGVVAGDSPTECRARTPGTTSYSRSTHGLLEGMIWLGSRRPPASSGVLSIIRCTAAGAGELSPRSSRSRSAHHHARFLSRPAGIGSTTSARCHRSHNRLARLSLLAPVTLQLRLRVVCSYRPDPDPVDMPAASLQPPTSQTDDITSHSDGDASKHHGGATRIPKLAAQAADLVGAKNVGKLAAAAGSTITSTAAKAIGMDTAADTVAEMGPAKASATMKALGPEHVAHLAEKLGADRTGQLAERVGQDVMGDLGQLLGVDQTAALFQDMNPTTIAGIIHQLGPSSAAQLMRRLGPVFAGELLLALGPAAFGNLVAAMGCDLAAATMQAVGVQYATLLAHTLGSVAAGVVLRSAGVSVVSNLTVLLGTQFAAELVLGNMGVIMTLGPRLTAGLLWELGPSYFLEVVVHMALLLWGRLLGALLGPLLGVGRGKRRPEQTWQPTAPAADENGGTAGLIA